MSSRQLQKLAAQQKVKVAVTKSNYNNNDDNSNNNDDDSNNDDNDDDDDDEDDDDVQTLKKSKFVFDSDSDSDSSSDSNSDTAEVIQSPPPPPPTTTTIKKKQEKKTQEEDDDEYLDQILQQQHQQQQQQQQQQQDSDRLKDMFIIDTKTMDIDSILRRRFGNIVINDNNNNNRGGQRRGQSNRNTLALRKLIFCISPKEGWKKPPSFGLGGMVCMKVNPPNWCKSNSNSNSKEQWYSFEWSKDFIKLHQKYELVQGSGDANKLVLFLAKNYYHIPGLIQLAMIYVSIQNSMDTAHDLIRNALYIFECSFIESFKPAQAAGYHCRMDFDVKENNYFYVALFRHMQISNMMGCASLSADIAKMIFSLDPIRDPLNILLHLDHYFLSDNNYDSIFQWLGYNDSKKDNLYAVQSPFQLYTQNDASILYLSDLPSWWYSAAMGLFLKEGGGVDSDNLLQHAIKQYPFMLTPLLLKLNIDVKASNWQDIVSVIDTLLLKYADSNKESYLKIANFYASRNVTLWNRDIVQEWLLRNSKIIIDSIKEISVISKYGKHTAIKKYSDFDEYDLLEDLPRLPAEANPLEVNLRELQQQNINFRAMEDNLNNLEQVDDILNELIENFDGQIDENLLMEELVNLQDMGVNLQLDVVLRRVRDLQRDRNNNNNNNDNNNNNNNNNNINDINNNNNNNDINNNDNNNDNDNNKQEESSVLLVRKNLDLSNNIIIIFLMSLLPWYIIN